MREKASIVMAAWNGEKYIEQQISSIVSQLNPEDELIISLDPCTDRTEEIIRAMNIPGLKLVQGPGRGVQANFENGLRYALNPVIFLADQDDVWLEKKMDAVLKQFEDESVSCVVHDCRIVNEKMEVTAPSFFRICGTRQGALRNLIRNSYIGCCMAFRRECLEDILPFPAKIPMHDQWIGIVSGQKGRTVFLEEAFLLYRRHGDNATQLHPSALARQLCWRINLSLALVRRLMFSR